MNIVFRTYVAILHLGVQLQTIDAPQHLREQVNNVSEEIENIIDYAQADQDQPHLTSELLHILNSCKSIYNKIEDRSPRATECFHDAFRTFDMIILVNNLDTLRDVLIEERKIISRQVAQLIEDRSTSLEITQLNTYFCFDKFCSKLLDMITKCIHKKIFFG